MTIWTLVARGLAHHRRMHLAVLLGVAAAAAMLTGALVVGDSVRGSLRDLAVEQLGQIDQALVVDRFFRAQLADKLAAAPAFEEHFTAAVPVIFLRGTIANPESGQRASSVNVVGCDERFAAAGAGAPALPIDPGQIVVNEPLARELGVGVGNEVILRIPLAADVPPDSPWGRKTDTIRSRRLKVREVLPARSLGRFTIRPTQRETLVAYVSLSLLQGVVEEPDRVNALFVTGREPLRPAGSTADTALAQALKPTLADYGLSVAATPRGDISLTSDRMLLAPAVESGVLADWKAGPGHTVFAYLANTIAAGDAEIPYSVVAAVDFDDRPPWGPLVDLDGNSIGPLEPDEIVLNHWAADDLGGNLKPGDTVRLTYFEPESTHGEVRETTAEFRLKAICRLEGVAADRSLTPEVKGVTDQQSIEDWDPPFPFDPERVREQDEEYWDDHRGTPKAFVNLAAGQKLWGSRFGRATSIVVPRPAGGQPPDDAVVAEYASKVRLDPPALGFKFEPLKRYALAASAGTTPFELLFLGFSFFLIAAAVMLVALLFRFGVEERAAEVGILEATGLRAAQVRHVLGFEALPVSLAGGILGAGLGVGYAWLMLAALRTWWHAAVNTTRLELHVAPASLAIGAVAATLIALAAIAWALWSARGVSVRRLLAGQMSEERYRPPRGQMVATVLSGLALVAGLALLVFAGRFDPAQQALAFFGSGSMVLIALIVFTWVWLTSGSASDSDDAATAGIARLSARNAARHAGRSTLAVGLIAAASFLIVALSAFRIEPAVTVRHDDGAGGFALIAESDQPILTDLNDPDARLDLGIGGASEKLLKQCRVYPLRVRPGDDASCLNLFQPRQPRILAASPALVERGGFAWAQTAAPASEAERADPWRMLDRALPPDAAGHARVPVVLDMNTALYSLHLSGGVGATYEIDDGRGGRVMLEIVGLLQNSILQGDLVIAESHFRRLFPDVSGYRVFLIDAPAAEVAAVQAELEEALSDFGLDAQPTADRLAGFAAVQNTYLSTFQSLGGLGLLLGTFGLATVQLRNVLERRGELALLRAVGLGDGRVAELVMLENVWLLIAGLAIGVTSALVAVVPHWLSRQATVPWLALAVTLTAVLAAGLLASLAAVRAALRANLLAALRGE